MLLPVFLSASRPSVPVNVSGTYKLEDNLQHFEDCAMAGGGGHTAGNTFFFVATDEAQTQAVAHKVCGPPRVVPTRQTGALSLLPCTVVVLRFWMSPLDENLGRALVNQERSDGGRCIDRSCPFRRLCARPTCISFVQHVRRCRAPRVLLSCSGFFEVGMNTRFLGRGVFRVVVLCPRKGEEEKIVTQGRLG